MTIEGIVRGHGIKEVLHFTTNRGLVGILHSGSIKSRSRLEKDEQLKFILKNNTALRKDRAWLDYVNLSIARINKQFFLSAERWHRDQDLWWCILSLSPAILSHEGVYFTTTNNIYTGVHRGKGPAALAAMFADTIVRWSGEVVSRSPDLPPEFTTCEQAEVLYPGEVPTSFLQRIYVAAEEDSDEVHGQLGVLGQPDIEVVVAPEKFNEVQY